MPGFSSGARMFGKNSKFAQKIASMGVGNSTGAKAGLLGANYLSGGFIGGVARGVGQRMGINSSRVLNIRGHQVRAASGKGLALSLGAAGAGATVMNKVYDKRDLSRHGSGGMYTAGFIGGPLGWASLAKARSDQGIRPFFPNKTGELFPDEDNL